jgi:hypothetical protein
MNRQAAVQWLEAQLGKKLDFDKLYGGQCVDLFNYYYQFITGRHPYGDNYGVAGAKDLWNVANSRLTKIVNNVNDPNQIPQPGDILVYNSRWGGGYGHVEFVISANASGVTVIGQNMLGKLDPVSKTTRSWGSIASGLIGWLSYNGFLVSNPVATDQRVVGANGVNYREKPYTSAKILQEFVPGDVLNFKGYVTGETVSGNDKWFVGKFTGGFCWSGAMTNPSTAGLPDLTPVTIPAPAPVEPPKYTFTKELECVTDVKPLGTQNFEYGNFPAAPTKGVVHQFGTLGVDTYQSTINTVTQNGSRVSGPHFVISGKTITQTASLKDRAYHAGAAGNSFVGIETDPAQDADTIESTKKVLRELKARYGYKLELVKHLSLASTACGKDVDLAKYEIDVPTPPPVVTPPVDPNLPTDGEDAVSWLSRILVWVKSILSKFKYKK